MWGLIHDALFCCNTECDSHKSLLKVVIDFQVLIEKHSFSLNRPTHCAVMLQLSGICLYVLDIFMYWGFVLVNIKFNSQ